MAKTPKLKKSTKPPSLHSRASKRLSSPSLNLDKSLTSLKPPAPSSNSNNRPSILAAHHGAGISKNKKKAKGKAISRVQRRRLEKGLERAEAVLDKTEKKVERNLGRGKVGRERKVAWEELNGKIGEVKGKPAKTKEGRLEKEDEDETGEWEDESMAEGAEHGLKGSDVPATTVEMEAAELRKPPDEDEDVIL